MSTKFFKKSKSARRCLPLVFLCIQSVDKKLKPSYLWDAFAADVSEIQSYLEELYFQKLIDNKLSTVCIGDDIFVTLYDSLKLHIDNFSFANVDLINVSQKLSVPSLVTHEEKIKILKPIMKCSQEILTHLDTESTNCIKNIDYTSCNPSTLFGVLLGYPVLYWFSNHSPDSNFTCLSMLPLKVHKIVTNISFPSSYSNMCFNSKSIPTYHELFSFSIPETVIKETENSVKSWFDKLMCKSKSSTIFYDLEIKTHVISLPFVSM